MSEGVLTPIEIGLNAAIVAVEADAPLILTIGGDRNEPPGLPFGPFNPLQHRTFESGLRAWVSEQTALPLGYVEQLYTFGDRGRHMRPGDSAPHVVSVGYLALARTSEESSAAFARSGAAWQPWYGFFPWEDWREGRPEILDETILPALRAWARERSRGGPETRPLSRAERVRLAFGEDGAPWDEERVLDRYELLYEAGLVEETLRDGRQPSGRKLAPLGLSMRFDHRRILATAISRLRGKLKYRPVVFELMPPDFTLTALQRTVEAISGRHLHKQNFRRLVETGALVEATGAMATETGGRPAALFRFRREVVQERPSPGLRLGQRG
ncbi:MAG: NAD regulator [Bauldia sp.]|nr:NAD regulator [Bauldia sp.]